MSSSCQTEWTTHPIHGREKLAGAKRGDKIRCTKRCPQKCSTLTRWLAAQRTRWAKVCHQQQRTLAEFRKLFSRATANHEVVDHRCKTSWLWTLTHLIKNTPTLKDRSFTIWSLSRTQSRRMQMSRSMDLRNKQATETWAKVYKKVTTIEWDPPKRKLWVKLQVAKQKIINKIDSETLNSVLNQNQVISVITR